MQDAEQWRELIGAAGPLVDQAITWIAERHDLTTAEGKRLYQRRAGVEGTLSQGVRAFGLRRCRYLGLAKAHLQHVIEEKAVVSDGEAVVLRVVAERSAQKKDVVSAVGATRHAAAPAPSVTQS